MILGLDLSTSTAGVAVLFDERTKQQPLLLEYLSFANCKDIWEKVKEAKEYLRIIFENYDIQTVYIEDIMKSFQSTKSSADVIITLAKFNGIISYLIKEVFNKNVVHINVNHARSLAGIKINKKDKVPAKVQALAWSKKELPNFDWPMKTLKSGPRKGQTIECEEAGDISDGYVIARAGLVIEQTLPT